MKALKHYLKFCFWAYVGIGYFALAYIALKSITDGFIVIYFDSLKYLELPLFTLIGAILIFKASVHLKQMGIWLQELLESRNRPRYY